MAVKIQRLGSYLEVNDQGQLVNPASLDNLQPQWRPAIDLVVSTLRQQYGQGLHSVYVRGSAAKGKAIEHISDLDTIILIKGAAEELDLSWTKDFQRRFKAAFPFIDKVELYVDSVEALPTDRNLQLDLKLGGLCVDGQDVIPGLPPIKPGHQAVQHLPAVDGEMAKLVVGLEPLTEVEKRQKCRWIMKRVLRSGLELVMEREQKYTRDLYLCYESFAKYYPEKAPQMYRVLELAIEPIADQITITETLRPFQGWFKAELERVYPKL